MNDQLKNDILTELIWGVVVVGLVFMTGLYAGWWDPFEGWLYPKR
jgi:hypothetical protein